MEDLRFLELLVALTSVLNGADRAPSSVGDSSLVLPGSVPNVQMELIPAAQICTLCHFVVKKLAEQVRKKDGVEHVKMVCWRNFLTKKCVFIDKNFVFFPKNRY